MTLEHKGSLKLLGYVCSNSQKYILWAKIIDLSFMPKIIRILSKYHVPFKILCTVNISNILVFLHPQIPDFLIVVS